MSTRPTQEATRGRRREFDRQRALETAMDLFWEHGYESTSVSQLCEGIGIKPPSLYSAFGSKAQLFLAVVDHYEREVWQPVWDAFEQEPLAKVAIRRLLDDTVEVITSQEAHLGCLVTLSAVSLTDRSTDVAQALTAIGDDGIRRIQAKLESGIHQGQIPTSTDTLALANAVDMMIDGLALRAHHGVPSEKLRRLARAGLAMIPDDATGRRAKAG